MRHNGIADVSATQRELRSLFQLKYGEESAMGWNPAMRLRFNYFTPDDCYEALVRKLVTTETKWLDLGCGRGLFPNSQSLSEELSSRAALLVGMDPDSTIDENPYIHAKVRGLLGDVIGYEPFDLITLRMVAEHVTIPETLISDLRPRLAPLGRVVVYTVDKWSPVPMITRLTPFGLHHSVKRILWRTEEKDTFPTAFKMNTRSRLKSLFNEGGFTESAFWYLDDCRTLHRFRLLQWAELMLRSMLNAMGTGYLERCLLGVYQPR